MPDSLLTYRTSTSPAPLQASSPGTPTESRINLAVTVPPGGQEVYCDSIQIAVPANDHGGGAFFAKQPEFSTSSDKWPPPSTARISGQELGLAQGSTWYRAIFHPAEEEYDLIGDPLVFGLRGTLSTSTGPLTYLIQEHSGTTPDRGTYTKKSRTLTLTVTEPVFYLRNFLARSAAKATAPQTKFASGSPVYLTWESNGTFFRLYDGDGNLVHPGSEKPFLTLENGVTNDTTFTLEASMSPETQGNMNGFEPIYQYATLTLTVTDPTLARLTVSGDLTAKSRLNVDGTLSAHNDLTVSQGLTASSWLSVHGRLSANNDLTVSGDLTAGSRLNVNGLLSANRDLTVNRDGSMKLTTDGTSGLRVTGPLAAESDMTVGWGGQSKLTTSGVNGLKVLNDIQVDGRAILSTLFHEPLAVGTDWHGPAETDGFLYIQTVGGAYGAIHVPGYGRIGFKEWSGYTIPIRKGNTWSFESGGGIDFIRWIYSR